MAALLTVGTAAASSADFTLTGETTALFVVGTTTLDPGAVAFVEVKSALGNYYQIGTLSALVNPFQVLSAPGTYRVSRPLGVSCGVDRT